MELSLSENIRKMRKERKLTQEKLAEALGVTVGAVYKWEAGLSQPELELIMEMADFFDTSVDVLLGYRMQDNRLEALTKRITELCRTMDPAALTEIEKTLAKYPNSFRLVYESAGIYLAFGASNNDKTQLRRALELLEQARILLPQNDDPRISEASICNNMATAYLKLGECEKGLQLLKDHMAELDRVANALLEMETLDAEQFEAIYSGTKTVEELQSEDSVKNKARKEVEDAEAAARAEREAEEAARLQSEQPGLQGGIRVSATRPTPRRIARIDRDGKISVIDEKDATEEDQPQKGDEK